MIIAVGLLAGWVVWLFVVRVSVSERSDQARFEAGSGPVVVVSPVSDTVLEVRARLGQRVSQGDALFVLDSQAARLAAIEARTERAALSGQVGRVERDDRSVPASLSHQGRVPTEARIAAIDATLARLDLEVDRRTIRAPVTGRIVDRVTAREGAVLETGTRLLTIVADGPPHVVAAMRAATAVGRVRPGQRASVLRIGAPWGSEGLVGRVEAIGTEPVDGKVPVDIAIEMTSSQPPFEHGVAAQVEVEIERVSIGRLILRAAGVDPSSASVGSERE
jgi:multidrug resistance efflux pump